MPDEIGMSASVSYKKGDVAESAKVSGVNADVAGTQFIRKVQSIATSYTDLDVTGLTGLSIVFVKNLDSTNYLSISFDGVADHIRLLSGEGCYVRPEGAIFKLKANTAAVDAEVFVIEA
jgi:hypothetical protein